VSLVARGWGWAIAAGLCGAVLVVLMSRSVIDHAVHYDELLHILSARGLLQTGLPAVADGFYTRAEIFTRSVMWSIKHFGDSPVSARYPALAGSAALVLLVGIWVTRQAGFLAGAAAAALLCVVPTTVDVSVFARFYTFHAVIMTLMFFAAYETLKPGRTVGTRVFAALLTLALVPLGLHFQSTTIIAVGAVVMALLALVVMDRWSLVRSLLMRRPFGAFVTLCFGAGAALFAVWQLGLLDEVGSSTLWAARDAKRYHYYLVEFRDDLPLLWPLLPAAAFLAVVSPVQRRLGVFCVVALGSALMVHSVAAQKSMRYVYYLVPLMCIVWAIAFSVLATSTFRGGLGSSSRSGPRASWVVVILAMAAILLSQEGARAGNLLVGRVSNLANQPFSDEPDWTSLVAELAPRAQLADRVVTSNSMKALYYLGRYDYELNATIVPETEDGAEFGRDERTGRQAIGTADSIRQVLAEPGTTLVVIEASKIGRTSGVTKEAYSTVMQMCENLTLPAATGVRAWWCGPAS
jgi:hypothetical protein